MAVIFQMATIHEKKTYTPPPPSERFPIFLSDILTFTNAFNFGNERENQLCMFYRNSSYRFFVSFNTLLHLSHVLQDLLFLPEVIRGLNIFYECGFKSVSVL